jgi:glycosyltransferase involved in cell wall biosynthesis
VRVLHTIASLRSDSGGPARTVAALSEALAAQGIAVEVVTRRGQAGEPEPLLPCASRVMTHLVSPRSRLGTPSATASSFRETVRARLEGRTDCILHDHGLWLPTNHAAAAVARRVGVPRLVSPRGMLSAWALQFHCWKKQTAWLLYQRRDLQAAQVLHATSEQELADFRRVGLQQPVALIPNGVQLPPQASNTLRSNGRRRALFLSRLHPSKGLNNLILAWAQVRPKNWSLVIAGPDESGYRADVEALARREGLLDEVTLLGPVREEQKWNVYQQADLFVLPTFGENFGLVVAEALASGIPVITTRAAPWPGLETHRCGWWIDVGAEPLATALQAATALRDEQRLEMGRRGREYVMREFSWDRVATDMCSVYTWILHGGTPPSCIVLS